MAEKRQAIEPNGTLNIQEQCDLLNLSRSSYYYEAKPMSEETEAIMKLIDKHYTMYPWEGARKINLMLLSHGYCIGRYATSRLMKAMGIEPIYPKPNTSAPNKAHEVYPYLLRETVINKVNQVWASDITYIRLHSGHVYLMAIMDWHSRYVIDWKLSISLEADFCVATLKRALATSRCEIFNTDQGSQFTSDEWINTLKAHHISISMDGRGRYLDNIFVERLWRSVKCECIYLHDFATVKEVKAALTQYFDYYNNVRKHQGLDYHTPAEVYYGHVNLNKYT